MGATASITSLEALTAEQVGDLVASMGPSFEVYRATFVSECINGVFIASLSADEMKETMADLGLTKALHGKNMCAQLTALKALAGASGAAGG